MEGYNALIFAYGQTASGKTHTLSGSPAEPGIIPLSIRDLFALIRNSPDREFLLRASYLELYNEALLDLLSADCKELSLSEGKKKGEVVVNGLTECAVRTEDDVRRLLSVGEVSLGCRRRRSALRHAGKPEGWEYELECPEFTKSLCFPLGQSSSIACSSE
jgi:hypothetical protein